MTTNTLKIDILRVLTDKTNPDVRKEILRVISTVDAAGKYIRMKEFAILPQLATLLETSNDSSEMEVILRFFINGLNNTTGVDPTVAREMFNADNLLRLLLARFFGDENTQSDEQTLKNKKLLIMLFSNLTINDEGCKQFVEHLKNDGDRLGQFIGVLLCDMNRKAASIDESKGIYYCWKELSIYAAYLIRNLAQSVDVRRILASVSDVGIKSGSGSSLDTILPILMFSPNEELKVAVADIVRNCCLDESLHKSLISIDSDDLLTALLYPLLGGEDLSEEENDVLPIELQYAGADKQRESSPRVQMKLLEALYQLCATSDVREYLRSKGTYYVLREYHKWMQKTFAEDKESQEIDIICANIIGVMIRYEDEIGCDNLKVLDEANE